MSRNITLPRFPAEDKPSAGGESRIKNRKRGKYVWEYTIHYKRY